MRNTTSISVAMLIISVATGMAAPQKVSWLKKTFGDLTWNEVGAVVESPKAISSRVRNHINYKEDFGDEHISGEEAWNRGYGDCEDFAASVVDLCKQIGVNAKIIAAFPEDSLEGHAIAVGKWHGKLWISSNGWYQTVKSMDDAKRFIAKEMGWRHKTIILKDINNTTEITASPSSTMVKPVCFVHP